MGTSDSEILTQDIDLGDTALMPFSRTGQRIWVESFRKTFFNANLGQGFYAWQRQSFARARETERVPNHEKAASHDRRKKGV